MTAQGAKLTEGQRAKPVKPPRIPMKGDDNAAWLAWWNACNVCAHFSAKYGCIRLGVVVYSNGAERGLPIVVGGCKAWEPRAALKDTPGDRP